MNKLTFLSAVNQIEFGNKGELYINVGSNTNGGLPGKLSGSGQLKENYFSAATLVADLSSATFDGYIDYDALDDGSPINYSGISVYASGLRNPFGLTMHSNGNLYGTDNGPNAGYGTFVLGKHVILSDTLCNQLKCYFIRLKQCRQNEGWLCCVRYIIGSTM
jgi:hypothetical protein